MATFPSGFTFVPTNYLGNPISNSSVDLADIFARKEIFLNSGLYGVGYNDYGKLGNGVTSYYSSPIQIGSLTNWKQVSAGAFHTMAVKTDGTLWGWGGTEQGQIGNGSGGQFLAYSSPVQVGTYSSWKQVSCGYNFSAAIKTDGTLWAWGYNNSGQLGNDTNIKYSSPVQIGSLTNWAQVFAGYATVAAVKTDGTLWGWGSNQNVGMLGNNAPGGDYSSPIQIGSLTNWAQVSVNADHMCAIKQDGTLWAWGNDSNGQLGNGASGTFMRYSSPVQIGSLTNWRQLGQGSANQWSAAIKTDGTLWVWGNNDKGQFGNDSTSTKYSSPIQVGALTNWKQLAIEYSSLAAIKTDGTLWAWGSNSRGQLANGNQIDYSSPIQVGSLTGWKQVARGGGSNYNNSMHIIYSSDLP